jgi:pyridoxal 5'-phosphate synthase pdxS subunit
MALERIPADIRQYGGVSRMVRGSPPRAFLLLTAVRQSDPEMIKSIVDAVTIPVMAKIRIGHFVEAQVSTQVQNPASSFI